LVRMAAIFCMFLAAYPPIMVTLCCGCGRCVYDSAKATLGTAKFYGGYGCITPPCLHWYTTIVTWRRRNSSKWWHIILLHTSFLGRGITSPIILPLLFFSSPAQEVLPLTNLLSHQDRGKFTLATLTPPLSSSLTYMRCFMYSNPREVPARDAWGSL
jgi:hypothetical protein